LPCRAEDGFLPDPALAATLMQGVRAVVLVTPNNPTGATYSPDLIANINPPTAALLLVGIAHTSLLSLHRERLERFSRRPRVAAFTAFVTVRTMTIYLWHMPIRLYMSSWPSREWPALAQAWRRTTGRRVAHPVARLRGRSGFPRSCARQEEGLLRQR
jgi:hypothetical protein